jgi:hypothetical protein
MSEEMDRKMRELMGRMVDMTPEAPPFPEEMVTLVPARHRPAPRPALVFAGAALLVLAIALPLFLLGGGTGVDPAVTTVPVPVPTTTVPDTGTTAVPELQVTMPVVVYLTQDPENSLRGNPALVPVATLGSAPEGQPASLAALRALLDPALTPPPGLDDTIPDEVAVLGVTEDGDTITVDMNQAFLAGAGSGFLGDVTMLNQLIYTATQGNPEVGVVFTVEGQAPGPYGSEGILLDTAFTRDYYRDEEINSVIVTTPVGPESTEISGVARVFEATVSLEIRDAAGEVVGSQFTMVTCGSGCWGEFTFQLDPALLEPGGQVRVFWNSPEDGDPSDVVTVPIPESEDGLWDLSP